jgi:general secretion pathway protein D
MLIKKVGHAVLFVVLLYSVWALPISAQPPVLSIAPSSLTVQLGQNVSLDVRITNVIDVYAVQFDVVFDPKILSAASITEGAFLPTGGTTFFIPGTIDNIAGTITATADSLIGPIPGVTGTGTLATITFHALTPGTSAITLANVLLLDSTGTVIPVSLANGTVQVGATPVPALSPFAQALLVVVICLSGLFFLLRRPRAA